MSNEALEANKTTVLAFYQAALNQSDFEVARSHFGPRYVQHNPAIKDGIDGFRNFVEDLKQRFPEVRGEIKRVFCRWRLRHFARSRQA